MSGFEEIIGNEQVIRHLKSGIRFRKLSHCYLISGEEGLGKRTLAKAFAKTLQCEKGGETPCGHCTSCMQVENENHPDVIFVRHEKPTVFSVDDIRDGLNRSIVIKPYKAERKIYILEDAQLLNVQAQNAMLKTIEEPPAYAIILLLTDNKEGFLPTILSRCVALDMRPVADQEIEAFLKKREGFQEEKLEMIQLFAQGNIGRAIAFLEKEEYRQMMDTVTEILTGLPDMGINGIREAVGRLIARREDMPVWIGQFLSWYRDVLYVKSGGSCRFPSRSAAVGRQAKRYTYEDLNRVFEEIGVFRSRMKVNVNMELSLELLLMKLQPA